MSDLCQQPAAAAVAALRSGEISAEEMTRGCLARIDEVEPEVQAWTFLDPERAIEQARALDVARQAGMPLGPLHGLPVGIKDIFNTRDMPTEYGTPLYAGRRPVADAWVVARLRAAGAVVLGKTVTTEFAVYAPGKTRNPHDPERTPGGSSSGSAAAVAAGMVPLALGSQTNGSTIRPASFCGVVGFKPTHGLIPRTGMLPLSRALDHVGLFGRSVADVALLAGVLAGYDSDDPDTRPCAHHDFAGLAGTPPPLPPRLALVRSPVWEAAGPEVRDGFAELADQLGGQVAEIELTGRFDDAVAAHQRVMEADLALSLAPEYARGRDGMSGRLREMIERGAGVRAVDYNRALARVPRLNAALDELFEEFDAILTPATPGPAPAGLDATGDPVFCTLWSLCGTPAISLPLLASGDGLPIGVQLVGARGDDGRLLRTARWLAGSVAGEGST